MTTKELYTKGARVWVEHPELVWEGATLAEDFRAPHMLLQLDSGPTRTLKVSAESELPPLQNPSLLVGQNDLTSLSYLHEPAVLHNLRVRFCERNAIYTYCGIVLVAINPYCELPVYGAETVAAYRGQAMGDLDPHIFAVAEEAYTRLEREARDQSIIVSGESGAGKTVSAKYAMRYFAAVGGSAAETHVERRVLASSPIMEAFGNAKTTRNDNSSRFGKFTELHFDPQQRIAGAGARTYLLEKSRVVYQARAERNYHVFYQLCAAAAAGLLPDQLRIGHQDTFQYLNQGGCAHIDGVDDLRAFHETRNAFTTLGVSEVEQGEVWAVLAGVLHLGDVRLDAAREPDEGGGDEAGGGEAGGEEEGGAHVAADDAALEAACAALRVGGAGRGALRRWLSRRRIAARGEVIEARRGAAGAAAARDALAKRLYADLFAWLVRAANRALDTAQQKHRNIGVLDIYGFETFEINSFEQFCINYANEKLQQQFNQHVFKLEQEEYLKEQISWRMIEFYDNQPCLELIEARLGVLALLDEECRVPRGSDLGFVAKLLERCAHYPHFRAPRFGNTAFIIKHFADSVEYQAGGFLEKNRDSVSEEQLECLRAHTQLRVLRELLDAGGGVGGAGGAGSSATLPPPARRRTAPAVPLASLTQPAARGSSQLQRPTVGAQFRSSLGALMSTLSATTPHYVRCIKPNDSKLPFQFDNARAVHQLRACGVLETIRISAAGFPSRWLYQDFFHRYRLLCPRRALEAGDVRAACELALRRHVRDAAMYRLGATKIFLRAGQVAYLERLRADTQRACCVRVQSCVRRFLARRRYLRVRRAVCGLQARARGLLARRRAWELRRARAAVTLQRHVRGWLARRRYQRLRGLVLALQARARGFLARRLYKERRLLKAVVGLQRYARGFLARQRVRRLRRGIVLAQACVRRWLARRRYRQLRVEARSLDHVRSLNRGLENKIISLQQRLNAALEQLRAADALPQQILDLKQKLESLRHVEAEARALRAAAAERERQAAELRAELAAEREAGRRAADQLREAEARAQRERHTAQAEAERLAAELRAQREHHDMLMEERAREAERQRAALSAELEAERQARQKLLAEQYELQERLDTADTAAASSRHPHPRHPHRRSLSDASGASQLEAGEGAEGAVGGEGAEGVEDDYGYGSVRSVESGGARPALEAVNWAAQPDHHAPMADPGLVLRMQARLAALHAELARQTKRAADLEERLRGRLEAGAGAGVGAAVGAGAGSERYRAEELEIENKKLREHLERLHSAPDAAAAHQELHAQAAALREELARRRDECVQLKSVLANQTVNLKSLASSNYGADVDIINEDGELASAYQAQKNINRQLQEELVSEKQFYAEQLAAARAELEQLRDRSESYHKLLSAELGADPKTKSQKFAQNEINRLVSENLALQERVDKLSESCRRYKRQVALLGDKLRELGLTDVSLLLEADGETEPPAGGARVAGGAAPLPVAAVSRKKEREYLGMFEYRLADEGKIIRKLIIDLKPRTATTLLPTLPAYILFMMLRHMDHVDDEPKMHSLMRAVRAAVKRVLKRRSDSAEHAALWLANMLRLLNNLRQYSGDAVYAGENTPRQNQQCLRVFDLSEYRQVLSDTAVWIYQGLVTLLERQLERLIVPAILEYEEISGLSGPARGGGAGGGGGGGSAAGAGPARLKHELATAHEIISTFAVEPSLRAGIFKQLFYYICAFSLNQLLLRKDLCCWEKGLQIRYNISHLENWIKEQLGGYGARAVQEALHVLRPVTQAVQLLQARKSMADVASTVEMCADLNAMQVCKILNMYTPAEEYEVKVTREFIHEIQKKMQERAPPHADKEPQNLLMDSKMIFSVQFPFSPSPIRLEDVELPDVLGLQGLLHKI